MANVEKGEVLVVGMFGERGREKELAAPRRSPLCVPCHHVSARHIREDPGEGAKLWEWHAVTGVSRQKNWSDDGQDFQGVGHP